MWVDGLDGRAPVLAVAVTDRAEVAGVARRAAAAGAGALELRVEALLAPEADVAADAADLARTAAGDPPDALPVVVTVRSRAEGGVGDLSDADRLAAYTAALPWATAVDVDVRSAIAAEVVARAHAADVAVLVSIHDYAATPPAADLLAVCDRARALGADVVKISTAATGPDDVRTLAAVCLALAGTTPFCVMAMGPQGTASRVAFPALGSSVAYTFLGAPSAPGQLDCATMHDLLARLYPAYAARAGR